MAGQQFQYDDSGNTFFYFLTSFVGLIVIPATYYLWPRDQNAGESGRRLAPLRSAPGRAAPHGPAGRGRTLRVRVTPPGQRGLGRGRGRGPPAWSAGVWLGSAPRRCGRPSPAASLSPRPGLSAFVGCPFSSRERAGLGPGGGEGRVGRGGPGACGHNSASPFAPVPLLPSPPGVPAAAVGADVGGHPRAGWHVWDFQVSSPAAAHPRHFLPWLLFFFLFSFFHLFSHIVGVAAVTPFIKAKIGVFFFSSFFLLRFLFSGVSCLPRKSAGTKD